MATSVSIKGKTQANDGVTSTINYVNPNATDAQLVSLATAFNNLTTNTVADITRIEKNSLLNTVEKLSRNLALAQSSVAWSAISTDINNPTAIEITGNALADIKAYLDINYTMEGFEGFLYSALSLGENSGIMLVRSSGSSDVAPTDSIEIFIPETDTYQAATATLTIT